MILLNSNAQHIFWLGRYLTRIQYLCGQFPFHDIKMRWDMHMLFACPLLMLAH